MRNEYFLNHHTFRLHHTVLRIKLQRLHMPYPYYIRISVYLYIISVLLKVIQVYKKTLEHCSVCVDKEFSVLRG